MTFVGVITFQVLACKGFFEIEKAVNAIVASTLIPRPVGQRRSGRSPLSLFWSTVAAG